MVENENILLEKVKSVLHLVEPDLKFAGKSNSPLCGLCHPAAVVLYRLLDGKQNGYRLNKALDANGFMHYWVVSPLGRILDPTASQYTDSGLVPPYANVISKGVSYRMPSAGFKIQNLLINARKITQIVKP